MILLPSHPQGQSKACFPRVYALGDTFSVVTPSSHVHPVLPHPLHVTHVMNAPGSYLIFWHSSASVYHCQHKPRNKEQGRSGNKATFPTV